MLRSRSGGAEIKLSPGAGAEITNYGPGSGSLPFYQIHARKYHFKSKKVIFKVPVKTVIKKKCKGRKNVRAGAGALIRIYGSAEVRTGPERKIYGSETPLKSTGTYLFTGTKYCVVSGATPSSRTLAERRPWKLSNRSELQTFLFFTPTLHRSFPFLTWVLPLFLRSFLHEVASYFAHTDSCFLSGREKCLPLFLSFFLQKVN
jgi:hypothetical protein